MMLNIGIIGMGYWGPNYIRVLSSLKSCSLAWCSDLDESKASLCQGARFTKNYREMLSDPKLGAVVICTPTSTHYEIAMDALKAGKHVLIEKPMTTDSKKAAEMAGLAEKKGLRLMVAHTFLYNPGVRKLKEYVDNGTVGDLVYFSAERRGLGPIRRDVNALWDLAPHDVSILLYLTGRKPDSVMAVGRSYVKKGREDVVFATAVYSNGLIANIHVSWLDPYKIRTTTVVGSKKMVVFDDVSNEKVKVFDKGVEFGPAGSYGEFKEIVRDGDILIPKVDGAEPLKVECEHFIDCVKSGKKPLSDARNGADVVRVLEAMQESLGTGSWVKV